ncbi:hypothetical protein A2U01_0074482, partial [Trifolium medium]|nr:hypothetical protein [Trifolium medium]
IALILLAQFGNAMQKLLAQDLKVLTVLVVNP